MVLTKKKQNAYLTYLQLYRHFTSMKRKSRQAFQNTLEQLSSKPYEIGMALARIRDNNILNLENFSLILTHHSPFEISSALIQLNNTGLLNPENKKTIENTSSPNEIALILRLLNVVKLLTPENRTAIQERNDLDSLINIFFKLYYANLFTQKNFDHVLAHPHLISLRNLLDTYNKPSILTQTLFEKIMAYQQEKEFLSYTTNEFQEVTVSAGQDSKPSLYHDHYVNFFSSCKQQQDKLIEINNLNTQIYKNSFFKS